MAKRYNFTKNLIDYIVDLYVNQNKTTKEISQKLNIGIWSITNQLIKRNIKRRSPSAFNRKYYLNEDYFKIIDTEEKAYFLGFLYADGAIYANNKNNRHYFHLTLHSSDLEILEVFKKSIPTNVPLRYYSKRNHTSLMISSEKMTKDLINLGCMPCKSFKIRFPTVEQVPDNFVRHFIRGYFDGDGCISFSEKHRRIEMRIMSNINFCYALERYLSKNCNIDKFYSQPIFESKNGGEFYTNVAFGKSEYIINFYKLIYNNATVFLNRKKKIFDSYIKYIGTPRKDVRKYKEVILKNKNNGQLLIINNIKRDCLKLNIDSSCIYDLIKNKINHYKNYVLQSVS